MSKSKLRHAAGMLKYKVLDCWPYKFKEMRAAKLRKQFRPRAFELPQLPPPDSVEVEIHMLCGKAQLDMGVWASWSILRFMNNALLYVHSDGTLECEDINSWEKVVRGLVFISKEKADTRVESEISVRWPLLYEWRCSYKSSAQVVDVHLFGETDRLVVMDSDVLCFREPVEVWGWVSAIEPAFRWHKDVRTCYIADIELLNQITGLSLPEAFTAGFCLIPRFGEKHFNHLEKVLKVLTTDGRVDIHRWWSPQTLDAICAAMDPHAKPLSRSYALTLGATSDDMVLRHYVGVPRVRPRYFTEGIPKLLASLAEENIQENSK